MSKITAIFIPCDPDQKIEARTFDRKPDLYRDLNRTIDADCGTTVSLDAMSPNHCLWVDDEGLLKSRTPNRRATILSAAFGGPTLLVGDALILGGDDEGDTQSVDGDAVVKGMTAAVLMFGL